MSVLDLQSMQAPKEKGPPPGSRTSKGCGNQTQSNTSLLLCIVIL
jgi:hypothetical protein